MGILVTKRASTFMISCTNVTVMKVSTSKVIDTIEKPKFNNPQMSFSKFNTSEKKAFGLLEEQLEKLGLN